MKWLNGFLNSSFQEYGNIIHFTEDEHGKLLVIDYGDYRTLNFDSPFEQSAMIIEQPYKLVHQYTQLMLLVLAFTKPSHITLLGLGGGSLLRTLHHILPDCTFKTLELRQKVVDIAYEYFDIPRDENRINISVRNALEDISACDSHSTDIIFADMYDAYQMVAEQTQKGFLIDCSRLLTHKGWLVINIHHLPQDPISFYELLNDVFPTVITSTNKVNTVIYLSNSQANEIITNLDSLEAAERMLEQSLIPLISRLQAK